jgi:hypothetical protein
VLLNKPTAKPPKRCSHLLLAIIHFIILPILVRNIISEIPPSIHEWRSGNSSSDPPQNEDPITIKDINELIKNNSDYYKRQNAYFYIDELTELDINYEKHKTRI